MTKIFRNTILYTLGNIFPQLAAFILLPIYTSYLNPSEYGIIESVNALNPILVILFSLCFGASIFRLSHEYKTDDQRRSFFGTIFISNTISSIFFLLLILIFRNYVEHIYKSISFYPYYLYFVLTAFTTSFFDLPKKYYMLQQKAGTYIMLSIFQFILISALILWFIIKKSEGAEGFLKAGLISAFLLLPVYLLISIKIIKFRFSFKIFRNLLHFSLPLIPTLLSAWVIDLSGRIFIERNFSVADVGIYSLSFKIASAVLILITSFDMAYRPAFFQFANDTNSLKGQESISKYNLGSLLAFIFISFIISLFAKEIIVFIFNIKYHQAYLYVPLILLSSLFGLSGGQVARFYEQSKKMKENMFIALGMSLINIISNFVLTPIMGIYGAVFSTLLSLITGFLFAYFYAKKHCFFVPFKWKYLFPVSTLFIITIILFQYFLKFDSVIISLLFKFLTLIILGVILALAYKKEATSIRNYAMGYIRKR